MGQPLISTWLSHVGSRHGLTLPLGFGSHMKLLHHSAVSYIPKDVSMSCCWSLCNSFLNSFCSAYATCLGDAWHGLLSCFACNENVSSKHPTPVNTSSNSFFSYSVILVLAFLVTLFAWTWKKIFNFIIVQ